MPVTHEDIALLQRSMEGLGDQFYRNRALNEASKRSDIERDLREKQLAIEQRRLDAEQSRAGIADRAEIASEDKDLLQSMIDLNAKGMMDDATREKANKVLAAHPRYGITGIQLSKPPTKPIPQSGQSARVREFEQARAYRDKAAALGPEGDLDLQKWYIAAADALEKGKGDTGGDYSIEHFPEQAAQPAKEASEGVNIFGMKVGAHPAKEAVPYKPATDIRRKLPRGSSVTSTNAPPAAVAGTTTAPLSLKSNSGKRVRVRKPNGETGTIAEGDMLPPGWVVIQ